MQERRTTIRINHRCRAQQCSSEDLLPHRGWICNLSERGVGLLVRKGYRPGERISVTFSLPGPREPITLAGIVRWSGSGARTDRWQRLGLEWLPPEETPRNRLQQWLASPLRSPRNPLLAFPAWLPAAALSVVLCVGMISGFWIVSLQRRRSQLETAVQQRDGVIRTLASHGQALERNLGAAKEQLAHTSAQVVHLDQQAHALEGAVQQLTHEVVSSQQAYITVQEDREALMRRVLDLEQERLLLSKRLASVPELRIAIKEAMEAHQRAQRAERHRLLVAQRAAKRQQLGLGNRGYLLRQGHPTVSSSTVWIRIHEPESSEPQAIQRGDDAIPTAVGQLEAPALRSHSLNQ